MKKLLPALLIFLAACGDDTGDRTITNNDATKVAETPTDPKNWYKRYTGTVAGQPVVANITMVDGALSGNYYYQSQGKLIDIYFNADSSKPNVYNVDESPEEVESRTQSQWEVTLNEHDISGMWKDAAGNKVYDIFLKEDAALSNLRVLNFSDSIPFNPGTAGPSATYDAVLILPARNMPDADAKFLNTIINKDLGCDANQTSEACLKAISAKYAVEYRQSVDSGDLDAHYNNHSQSDRMAVRYNDNGWLVLEHMSAGYTGGAHGNYASGFINVDLQNDKVWKLEEVMTVDSAKTSALLDAAARRRYGMAADEKLSGNYFEETIRLNGNFYLTHKGITFCYNPYEIASYAQGQIYLFIPYSQIMDLLTPAFRERMKLGKAEQK